VVDVAAHCAGSERTLDQEIALEGTKQRLGQRQRWFLLLVLQHAEHLQHFEQAPQSGS
jgi:uncharacterized protein (DUF924 family)